MMIIIEFLAVLIIAGFSAVEAANSAPLHNPPDCSQKLLAEWLWDSDAALADMPRQACLLHGEHDQYICSKANGGCIARN
jgi:hypothetical protein